MRRQTLSSLGRLLLFGSLLAAMTGCIRGAKGGSDICINKRPHVNGYGRFEIF